MNDPILKAENISHSFRSSTSIIGQSEKIALSGISFELLRNKSLGITGESGSGKTTLAKIIAGVILPEEGKVSYNFKSLNNKKAASPVQILFQNNGEILNPLRSVGDILKEVINFGKDERGRNFSTDELLKIVELAPEIKSSKCFQLSGGEQQRVALARILAIKPELLILDEPFSAQDLQSQMNFIKLISSIKTEFNVSIICISHEIKLLKLICDEMMILNNGKIQEIASTDKLFSHPTNNYTKFLLLASSLKLNHDDILNFYDQYEQDKRDKNT